MRVCVLSMYSLDIIVNENHNTWTRKTVTMFHRSHLYVQPKMNACISSQSVSENHKSIYQLREHRRRYRNHKRNAEWKRWREHGRGSDFRFNIYGSVILLQKEIYSVYFLLFCVLAYLLADWLVDSRSHILTIILVTHQTDSRAEWEPSKFHSKQANVLQWISSFIVVSSLLEVELSVCCSLWACSKIQCDSVLCVFVCVLFSRQYIHIHAIPVSPSRLCWLFQWYCIV